MREIEKNIIVNNLFQLKYFVMYMERIGILIIVNECLINNFIYIYYFGFNFMNF